MGLREVRGVFPGLMAPLPEPVTPVTGTLPPITTGRISRSGLITQPIYSSSEFDEIRSFPVRSGDPVVSGVDREADPPAGRMTREASDQKSPANGIAQLALMAGALFFWR